MSPPRAGLLRILILLAVVMAGGTTPLSAQVATPPAAPPTPTPPAAPTSPLTPSPGIPQPTKENFAEASVPLVKAFVQGQAALLAGEDIDAQSKAREQLVNESTIPGNPQKVSASYLDAYAAAVNEALAPLAQNPKTRIRLNVAIVVAKVANHADNSRLADTVLVLLQDKSDAVALWAMKAAHAVLPAVLRAPGFAANGPNGRMLTAIVPTVQAHTSGPVAGSIAEEAYGALSLDILNPNMRKKLTNPMLQAVLPEIHRLLDVRINEYVKGLPPHPFAEHLPAGFLSQGQVIALETPAQKLTSMQLLSNLIGLIAQQVGTVDDISREELATMVQRAAAAISVANTDPAIVAAVAPASKLSPKAKAAEIIAATQPILPALQKAFPALKAPPAIQAAAQPVPEDVATTSPTTAPATSAAK